MMTKKRTLALIEALLKMRSEATDEQASSMIMIYPVWKDDGQHYDAGERIRYNDELYKVVAAHNTKVGQTPDISTELYAKI